MARELKPQLVAMGRRMQARRDELHWSQQDVILKLEQAGIEITRAAYSHWETGRADIPSSALAVIANILSIPANYLLGQQSETEWLDEQAMLFYKGTSPDLRPTALATLKALFEASDRQRTTHGRKADDTDM
ncbi:MAG: Helix-turn-helix domain [Chthonomonadaceae bacterium]|jgi:transcriptional regulator with XRE-family HTH domain|nr:Helix-turn-helix domain [Chthonomonadaceae bacterium]